MISDFCQIKTHQFRNLLHLSDVFKSIPYDLNRQFIEYFTGKSFQRI